MSSHLSARYSRLSASSRFYPALPNLHEYFSLKISFGLLQKSEMIDVQLSFSRIRCLTRSDYGIHTAEMMEDSGDSEAELHQLALC